VAEPREAGGTFRAVALQPTVPRSLLGQAPAVAMGALADFKLQAGAKVPLAMKSFEDMYAGAVDDALRSTGNETFQALERVSQEKLASRPPENGAHYPKSPLGRRMEDIARLIHADLGLEIAATDCGGWDTHIGQGGAKGQLAQRLADLGEALSAFTTDLGPRLRDVVVVTMTEFGRTVRENGNRGTDHGTASVMFVLGGSVHGGHVLADWRGLAQASLFEDRDVAVTTDFREPLSEVLRFHLGIPDTGKVFPAFQSTKRSPLFG
jgi:uncharacterized protein (DUF1501 family)